MFDDSLLPAVEFPNRVATNGGSILEDRNPLSSVAVGQDPGHLGSTQISCLPLRAVSFNDHSGPYKHCHCHFWHITYRLKNGSEGKASACKVEDLGSIPETWVWSLGQEDPLEKEMAFHSSTLAWKIPRTEKPGAGYSPWDRKESDTPERLHFHFTDITSRCAVLACKTLHDLTQLLLQSHLHWFSVGTLHSQGTQ